MKYPYILALLLSFSVTLVMAQGPVNRTTASSPKIGLVLSGGGAKGLAYIGLLKKIDSLGIKVSYITGTSMGGVIGGLYAMGYSGKQLEAIVMHINWDLALSNNVPLNQINIEEKDEYQRYLFELPVHKGKPSLPVSVIDGQYLSEIFNTYTYPVRGINDFSKLNIPLRLTSSNIADGALVIQKSGSLAMAMRATMAIPAVFTPVYIDGKTLVDGGITQNYPASEVRKMGAEYVIGGYTGFHLMKGDELESPFNMLMQTMSFGETEDFEKQKRQTDLMIDYSEVLKGYSSADFARYQEIMKRGELEAEKHLPQLIEIAKQQGANATLRSDRQLKEDNTPIADYHFVTNLNKPITDPEELKVLEQIWKLKSNTAYHVETVNQNIRDIYGTRFYDKVYYTFNKGDNGLEMDVHLKKGKKGRFKAALHYDTDQSAGIVLNYTYYNFFLNRSRFLVTVDAAERFKARTNYYKFISADNKLWLRGEAEYRNVKSNDLLLSLFSVGQLNSLPPDYFTKSFSASPSIGYSFNHAMYAQFGVSYESENVHRAESVVSKIIGVNPINNVYHHENGALFLKLVQNSMSSAYYPVSGNKFETVFKYTFGNHINLNNIAGSNPDETGIYQYLNPESDLYNPDGNPGNISRFYLKEEAAIPLMSALSLKVGLIAGLTGSSRFGVNKGSYLFLNNYFGLGGTDESERDSDQGFIGLRQGELSLRGLTAFNLSLQFSPFKKIYFIPMVSYGAESDGYNLTANLFRKKRNNLGYGLHLGYLSFIGPVDFVFSKSNIVNGIHLPWRAYLSLGYKF